MLRRFVKDESGVALGLAVIMIVLIGVMGAGLLVFVRAGLNSTIQVNQGQKAIGMADAGVQAAKRQLILNATPTHYDGTTNLSASPPNPESEWSYIGAGKTLSLVGCNNCINVKIRYLLPATNSSPLNGRANPNYAPELTPNNGGDANYPPGVDYFRITSQGTAGETRRVVDAIYVTQTSGSPQGYYTPGNVVISGNITLEGLSMFAGGNITANSTPGTVGSDLAYGDWGNRPPWNTTPSRGNTLPGLGAAGTVPLISGQQGVRDFGSNTTPIKLEPKNPPDSIRNDPTKIAFPFDVRQQPILEDLRNAARIQNIAVRPQGNYYDVPSGTSTVNLVESTAAGTYKWPAGSVVETVVYIRFPSYSSSNVVNWDARSSVAPNKGTLVVENGRLEMTPSTNSNPKCLTGVAVVRVPSTVAASTEVFTNAGQGCLEGYANANASIKIVGTVKPFTQERGNRPGFYGVQLWSWRECYTATCT